MAIELQVAQNLFEDLSAAADGHRLFHKISHAVRTHPESPPDHYIRRLIDELRLVEQCQRKNPG